MWIIETTYYRIAEYGGLEIRGKRHGAMQCDEMSGS